MKRLLIANRGEIALRVQRACTELGIETVAAYSRADQDLLHLSLADQTVCIGATSYLNATQLLAAAVTLDCDAVHPGYGLLSEDAAFAAGVEERGLTFVGPTSQQIELMGDKARARGWLAEQGIPVLPGSTGRLGNDDNAHQIAAEIGYPVLLKASHGGGGRGIVIVETPAALEPAMQKVAAEADAFFGSADCYLEKYLQDARHIEIQVVGDGHGKVLQLGARECSIQRRHQKLIEESPPPGISTAHINQLATLCAEALARLNYRNVGTLEFLYADEAFYFIEMNTRIQVEHPVTEAVTGLDLVKLQLQLAAGEELKLEQASINSQGHAIECRINAEDENFMPSPGPVDVLQTPGGMGVRFDSHLYAGYTVPHYYDSLLGKLIVTGQDRAEAIARMKRALAELKIEPIETNALTHRQVLNHSDFVSGRLSTRFLERD
ncbi:MAG: acetyl-CoA carboxylase biotin carboxylase subunit [Pseudomonadales bacterium]